MPRKAKTKEENSDINKDVKKTSNKSKTTTKKTSSTRTSTTQKTSSKVAKKVQNTDKKSTVKKTTTTSKKTLNKKVPSKKNKKNLKTIRVVKTIKTKLKRAKLFANLIEYYDLPYSYNQTVIKVLAQTPTILFVYWEISKEDRELLETNYGKNFFNSTYPVLVVHNLSKNYHFEVPIDDFANNWYIHVPDSKCKYHIELGRRSRSSEIIFPNNYLSITSSNEIESPNDHILFEELGNTIYYMNVKNNEITTKDIASLSFMKRIGKIYNIYDLYKKMYKEQELDLKNPSSNNPTSTFR